jgi:MFS family permease
MLGPIMGGLIVGYFHWRIIFFVNIPIGLLGLYMVYKHLPNYFEKTNYPLDIVGLVLFGSGIALLSYVLEIFGDHTLSGREILGLLAISAALLATYGFHNMRTAHPLLNLGLLRIRTFRVAVSGNMFTRLGIGGIPFLLPLLYQVGLGYSAIQSGLLIMPQAMAAMSLKLILSKILKRFGYRRVLMANTLMLGALIMLFATIGVGTPVWLIVGMAFCYGFLSSLQYTSMNTLAFADIKEQQASGASTIASTVQQLAVSFGVATASLAAALFIPSNLSEHAPHMIQGVHSALLAMGGLTILSAVVFMHLRVADGAIMSQHKDKVELPAA